MISSCHCDWQARVRVDHHFYTNITGNFALLDSHPWMGVASLRFKLTIHERRFHGLSLNLSYCLCVVLYVFLTSVRASFGLSLLKTCWEMDWILGVVPIGLWWTYRYNSKYPSILDIPSIVSSHLVSSVPQIGFGCKSILTKIKWLLKMGMDFMEIKLEEKLWLLSLLFNLIWKTWNVSYNVVKS